MSINVFVPKFEIDEVLAEIRECLERGWTGIGFKTVAFEKAWGEYTGLPHSHFLSSNTAGLHLAVNLFKHQRGWSDGDEIISTPLTFVSSNHAIMYERLKPVFADVDASLCLDPEAVARRITPRTRAVMYVGMGGNAGRLSDMIQLCKSKGLVLILDAAHMAGAKYRRRHVGHGVDVTVFSYQAVKNLPTADAGMICCADPALDAVVRRLSWLGINKDTYQRFDATENRYRWKYDVEHVGFKYHGNSIQAAIGLVQLKYLERDNARRREICAHYDALLAGDERIARVPTSPDCDSARHLYQVRVKDRDRVVEHMAAKDVFVGVHYRDNTEYEMYRYGHGTCPTAHDASQEILSLPLHLRLTNDECVFVARALKEAVGKKELKAG